MLRLLSGTTLTFESANLSCAIWIFFAALELSFSFLEPNRLSVQWKVVDYGVQFT